MLNKSKSVFIPFCISKTNKPEHISIKLHKSNCKEKHKAICLSNCIDISRASDAKYLGVIFDEHIKWTKHINMIIIRLRKCFYIFKELRNILDINNLRMIYFALAQSIITYGITIWGSAYKNALEPLMITHRILVRIIMRNYYLVTDNTETLFKKLKILTINKLSTIKIHASKKDYEIFNVYNKRYECNNNLKLLKCNTTLMKMFYINRGIELFNRLPNNIKTIKNIK